MPSKKDKGKAKATDAPPKEITQKDLEKLAKDVDKIASKVQHRQEKALAKGEPIKEKKIDPAKEAEMRKKIEAMVQALSNMEQTGAIKASGRKDMGDHKFWNTQPVIQHGECKGMAVGNISISVFSKLHLQAKISPKRVLLIRRFLGIRCSRSPTRCLKNLSGVKWIFRMTSRYETTFLFELLWCQ